MIQMKSGNSAIIELKKEVVKEVALVKSARQEPKQEEVKELRVSSFGLQKDLIAIKDIPKQHVNPGQ